LKKAILDTLGKHHLKPNSTGVITISPQQGKTIANELLEIKTALHFVVYQECSTDGKNEIYTKLKKERANNYL